MNTFGDLIQYLDIVFFLFDEVESSQIVKLINDKCSKTLKELNLKSCKRNVLNDWDKTFDKINSLTFSIVEGESNRENKKLSQFFPNVVNLHLEYMNRNDWSFVDGQFPKVISPEIIVHLNETANINEHSYIANFFKNNNQINTLRIQDPSPEVLSHAKTLSNLKSLIIDGRFHIYEHFEVDIIHFSSVEKVKIMTHNDNPMLKKLVFDGLQSLTMDVTFNYKPDSDVWSEFFNNQMNWNLKTFTFTVYQLTKDELLTFSEKWPNLEIVVIQTKSQVLNANGIIEFIANSEHLKCLEIGYLIDPIINVLRGKLEAEWDVQFEGWSNKRTVKIIRKYVEC